MKATAVVNKLLEADFDDIGDLERYAKETPGWLMSRQAEVEAGLVKLGFTKQKQTRRDIKEYGAAVVTYFKDLGFGTDLHMTRTIDGIGGASTANPIWAVDIFTPYGDVTHAHAGICQDNLLDFLTEFLRERRLSARMTIPLFQQITKAHGA